MEKLIEKISSNPDEYNGRQLQMCEFGLEGISDFKFNHQNNTLEVQSDTNWKGVLHIEYSKDKGLKVSSKIVRMKEVEIQEHVVPVPHNSNTGRSNHPSSYVEKYLNSKQNRTERGM